MLIKELLLETPTYVQVQRLEDWIDQLAKLKDQFAPYAAKDPQARQAYYTAKNRLKQAQGKLAKLTQKI